MSKTLIFLGLIIFLFLGYAFFAGQEGISEYSEEVTIFEPNTQGGGTIADVSPNLTITNDNQSESTTNTGYEAEPLILRTGLYTDYDPEKVAYSSDDTKVVIFFSASWCPTCRAADSAIKRGIVPEGVIILKADYDDETALKRRYGIRYQHTFVQVDADGNAINTFSGSRSIESIVNNLI